MAPLPRLTFIAIRLLLTTSASGLFPRTMASLVESSPSLLPSILKPCLTIGAGIDTIRPALALTRMKVPSSSLLVLPILVRTVPLVSKLLRRLRAKVLNGDPLNRGQKIILIPLLLTWINVNWAWSPNALFLLPPIRTGSNGECCFRLTLLNVYTGRLLTPLRARLK